ncbi:CDP-alcohol phosphatidyltransferase family protein [Deinococcus sp. QL22]|uniref:CDP-alcohol phosphatidyltransferase family protein n=1 Tax=Deinococcus sp. QL22 TaxID=2939437 RepID=UPI002017A584|nr:CDP-alcohol phosphatidyltransferase family protein [Deinococcus sp. QL22]UQN07547.1 CDP-alcohol phosphatidyltransferase family protein [Deinococcus sp. QL22]
MPAASSPPSGPQLADSDLAAPTLEQTRKARPGIEWASERIFRPVAQRLIGPFARRGVNPAHLVLFHTALGLYVAHSIRRGGRLTPALLLQVKTVLDNLDGQLARATGQTTETGRYLDTEMDLVVNVALNVALVGRWGIPLTLLQSLILTVDYLWERDYRAARGEEFRASPAQSTDNPQVLAALKAVYAAYFVPQEKLLGTVFERRLTSVTGPAPTQTQRVAYTPQLITGVAANLGLSTQLLALGACLLLGKPRLYAASLPVQAAVLLGAQLWREGQVERSAKPRS